MSGRATPSYGDDDGGEGLRHFHVEDGTNAFGGPGHVSFPEREASARATDSGDERRPTGPLWSSDTANRPKRAFSVVAKFKVPRVWLIGNII
jgi:hypothetical protein